MKKHVDLEQRRTNKYKEKAFYLFGRKLWCNEKEGVFNGIETVDGCV